MTLITMNSRKVNHFYEYFQGCLPLVLMFDMKQDDSISATEEASKNNQLMESLDVFISIKLKPKQPSKVRFAFISRKIITQSFTIF